MYVGRGVQSLIDQSVRSRLIDWRHAVGGARSRVSTYRSIDATYAHRYFPLYYWLQSDKSTQEKTMGQQADE